MSLAVTVAAYSSAFNMLMQFVGASSSPVRWDGIYSLWSSMMNGTGEIVNLNVEDERLVSTRVSDNVNCATESNTKDAFGRWA